MWGKLTLPFKVSAVYWCQVVRVYMALKSHMTLELTGAQKQGLWATDCDRKCMVHGKSYAHTILWYQFCIFGVPILSISLRVTEPSVKKIYLNQCEYSVQQWFICIHYHIFRLSWKACLLYGPSIPLDLYFTWWRPRDHLYLHPANERWCYIVTLSLIGWARIQNDPWRLQTADTPNRNETGINTRGLDIKLLDRMRSDCSWNCWNIPHIDAFVK